MTKEERATAQKYGLNDKEYLMKRQLYIVGKAIFNWARLTTTRSESNTRDTALNSKRLTNLAENVCKFKGKTTC